MKDDVNTSLDILWINHLRIVVEDRKVPGRRRIRFVHTETDGAHCGHGDEVEDMQSSIADCE